MNLIPNALREEYKTLKALNLMIEPETISVETLIEQSFALDHIMRATEEDCEEQIERARAHFIRAGRDIYFQLLTPKLDRLQALSSYLPPGDLARFRNEYQKIKASVETARKEPEKILSLAEYFTSLAEIDDFLGSFAELDIEVDRLKEWQKEKNMKVLFAILFGLLGAVFGAVSPYLFSFITK